MSSRSRDATTMIIMYLLIKIQVTVKNAFRIGGDEIFILLVN